jgi:hypothetical protein
MPPLGKAVTDQHNSGFPSKIFFVLFFGAFLGAGMLTLWLMAIGPWLNMRASQDWVPVDCTIVSSEVESHSDSDGTTYSIEISYEYEYEGKTYQSDRYHFLTGSSSGYAGKKEVVDRYPPGKEATCLVDPSNPQQAVIDNTWSGQWWMALFPIPFLLVGAGGLIGVFVIAPIYRQRKRERALTAGRSPHALAEQNEPNYTGRVVLQPETGPLGKFIGMSIFALFWNGISGTIFVVADALVARIFLSLFLLVGLFIIGLAVHAFLQIFNPKVDLVLENGMPRLGRPVDLGWQMIGRSDVVQTLTITLIGREEATYQRGTNTVTDKEEFFKQVLLETEDKSRMQVGEVELNVPADTMHSWEASKNKIVWILKVHGDIRRWPDISDEYEVKVQPLKVERVYA